MYLIIGILAFVFLFIGVILLIVGLRTRQKAQSAQKWPTVTGNITDIDIKEHISHHTSDRRRYTRSTFEPIVQYSYAVNSAPYTNQKIAFGANSFDIDTAKKKIANYTVGGNVQVHYNPSKPEEAVLETNGSGSLLFIIVGIVFAIFGCLASIIIPIIYIVSQS